RCAASPGPAPRWGRRGSGAGTTRPRPGGSRRRRPRSGSGARARARSAGSPRSLCREGMTPTPTPFWRHVLRGGEERRWNQARRGLEGGEGRGGGGEVVGEGGIAVDLPGQGLGRQPLRDAPAPRDDV